MPPRDPSGQPILATLAVLLFLLVYVLFVYADIGQPIMELLR